MNTGIWEHKAPTGKYTALPMVAAEKERLDLAPTVWLAPPQRTFPICLQHSCSFCEGKATWNWTYFPIIKPVIVAEWHRF